MKNKSYEVNLREFAGSMGDLGTLFPIALGYLAINGLNPSGFLVMLGIVNIITGLVYKIPLPIQPMKILAATAISQQWAPSMIYASGFAMGIVWLLITLTGLMKWIVKVTPMAVIRGIQVALGISLALQALPRLRTGWLLALIAILIIVFFRQSRKAPAAVVLMGLGLTIALVTGDWSNIQTPGFAWPTITAFKPKEVWDSLLLAGFAQVPLTVGNAVIATAILIRQYWPERTDITEHSLSLSQGIMNLVAPFFGGFPMCHGAGGLAGKYYFGARTGGTNIIEGTIEVILGLFFGGSIIAVFAAFPQAIIGAMMLLVGVELAKFAKGAKFDKDLIPMLTTIGLALVVNMAIGFIGGLIVAQALKYLDPNRHKNQENEAQNQI